MSEARLDHTPGPWKAIKGHDGDEDRWTVSVDGPMAYLIAVIENGAPGDTLDTEEFNARLFAVAPDMLAALQRIANLGRSQAVLDLNKKVGDPTAVAYEHQHLARAVLAKLKACSPGDGKA